jgi:hypothetical protein
MMLRAEGRDRRMRGRGAASHGQGAARTRLVEAAETLAGSLHQRGDFRNCPLNPAEVLEAQVRITVVVA